MRPARTDFTHWSAVRCLFLLVAGLLALAPASAVGQERVTFIPAAPPEGAELAYNIPLDSWVIPTVLELKTEFSDGLASEFAWIAEHQTGEDLAALVESGRSLAAAAEQVRETIAAIGAEDVTFGIEGISRIIPAEGALRDTFFGFVVWHEFPSAPAKPAMTRFEDLVGTVVAGGEAAGGLAEGLADLEEQLTAAVDAREADRIAALTPDIVETAGRVDAVCASVAVSARELEQLILELSADSREILVDKWAAAAAAAAGTAAPAETSGPALASVSGVLQLLVELGGVVGEVRESVEDVRAAEPRAGVVFIPWTVLRTDWEVVRDLDEHVLAAAEETQRTGEEVEGAGESGHAGHAHGDRGERFGDIVTDETRQRIRALFARQVAADAILAKLAVENASTLVAGTVDELEDKLLARTGYSADMSERQQKKAFEEVDAGLRENVELVSARISAKAARTALRKGRSSQALGAGHEVDALYQYHNAWLHSLNAGAAAQRALLQ